MTATEHMERLLAKADSIGTLPATAQKVIDLVEDPRSSAAHLIQVVSHDPTLATRLMRIVNSAFYGMPREITSLEMAITLLGMNAVRNIALASSMERLFVDARPLGGGFAPHDLWTHSLAVAVAAREIARLCRPGAQHEAFLLGITHDIGIILMQQQAPQILTRVIDTVAAGEAAYGLAEFAEYGFDHAQLGAALAERWEFAPLLVQSIALHHAPQEATDPATRELAQMVYLADTIACRQPLGFNLTARLQPLRGDIMDELDVTGAQLEEIGKRLGHLTQQAMPASHAA